MELRASPTSRLDDLAQRLGVPFGKSRDCIGPSSQPYRTVPAADLRSVRLPKTDARPRRVSGRCLPHPRSFQPTRRADAFHRTERAQQNLFAVLADAGAIVQDALADAPLHQELVVTIGEPVRLVADALEQTQRPRILRQPQRRGSAGTIDFLELLRQPNNGQVMQPEFLQLRARAAELALCRRPRSRGQADAPACGAEPTLVRVQGRLHRRPCPAIRSSGVSASVSSSASASSSRSISPSSSASVSSASKPGPSMSSSPSRLALCAAAVGAGFSGVVGVGRIAAVRRGREPPKRVVRVFLRKLRRVAVLLARFDQAPSHIAAGRPPPCWRNRSGP